jgi:isopenicillin-N epimerase
MNVKCDVEQRNVLWGDDWLSLRRQWSLDYSVFLFSHGAYGASPISVREKQLELQERIQRNPTGFFRRELMPLLEEARIRAAQFCGADPANAAWVRNATDGMTVAINALPLESEDEIIITNHIYPAVRFAVERRCAATGAKIVEAQVPITDDDNVLMIAIEAKLSKRTRALVVDEIAASTGRIFPVARIAKLTQAQGIPLVVDGAHAPGMTALALEQLGVDMWVGNMHKWVCAPHVAALLYVAPRWHERVQPLSASFREGYPFPKNFGRLGTDDLTGALCVPAAIDFVEGIGLSKIQQYSYELAALGASKISSALKSAPVSGKFAGRHPIALPPGIALDGTEASALQTLIATELHAELSVCEPMAGEDFACILISAFVYNHPDEYERFGELFADWLARKY